MPMTITITKIIAMIIADDDDDVGDDDNGDNGYSNEDNVFFTYRAPLKSTYC